MRPIVDPRKGDIEDDASSTKRRTLIALGGSLLAEISLPKLLAAWFMLIVLPVLVLGLGPLLVSIWISTVSTQAAAIFTGLGPILLLAALAGVGWYGGKPLWRLLETNFWSLNALAVQPGYALAREGLRHLAERLLPADASPALRARLRAVSAAVAGLLVCAISAWFVVLVWPAARWTGSFADLSDLRHIALLACANSVAIVATYVAVAGLTWGIADATMGQPIDLPAFATGKSSGGSWRVAHLSDIHIVGEPYGFRIESGRSGPRGNERLAVLFAKLDAIHREKPLDVVLISGDLTDAGRSSEWAEFLDAIAPYPELAQRIIALPGNHDLNVVDRANPARLDLPMSPNKRLRQIRALAMLAGLQGERMHLVDEKTGDLGPTVAEAIEPHREGIVAFVDRGSLRLSAALSEIWVGSFPMVLPPKTPDGLGVVVLNSNAETHFSFTNALGLVSKEQTEALGKVTARYPRAYWIVALHHHLVEYPRQARALSERIGTALVNGSWFVRRLQRLSGRAVAMHGHRHIDWIGSCGGLLVVSAPSPVMDVTDGAETYFYVHNLGVDASGRLALFEPDRIVLPGRRAVTAPVAAPLHAIFS